MAEAVAAGFAGAVAYDERRGTLHFEGLGDLDVSRPFARAGELEGDARRQYVKGTVVTFLRSAAPLPARYAGVGGELGESIRNQLEAEAKYPASPVPQEMLGRIERYLGLARWEDRLRRSADAYLEWFRSHGDVSDVLRAANLRRLVGDAAVAGALASEALERIDPAAWGDTSLNPLAGQRCAALALLDDVAGLAAELEARGAIVLGPRWTPVAAAAAAAVRGDGVSLRREVDAWRSLAATENVDTNGLAPSNRDLLEIMEGWLASSAK